VNGLNPSTNFAVIGNRFHVTTRI